MEFKFSEAEPKFKPVKIELVLETEDELVEFLSRMNISAHDTKYACPERYAEFLKNAGGISHKIYNELESIAEKRLITKGS